MKLSIEDIIKVLPFDEALKSELLNNFSNYSLDQRFALEQIIWQTYDSIFKIKLEENVEIAIAEAEEKGVPPEKDFYKKIREKTKQEIHSQHSLVVEEGDLEAARSSLAQIINTTSSN